MIQLNKCPLGRIYDYQNTYPLWKMMAYIWKGNQKIVFLDYGGRAAIEHCFHNFQLCFLHNILGSAMLQISLFDDRYCYITSNAEGSTGMT